MVTRLLLPLTAVLTCVAGAPFPTTAQVKAAESPPEMKPAVKPKELSAAVKRGLEYLAKTQRDDGGWGEGGLGTAKGQSDVANTSLAVLALVRAGNTPTAGEYNEAVAKGLKFVLAKVEAADTTSLALADAKDFPLQLKFGTAVDTFLANRLLAELRGKAGDEEKRLVAALEKTTAKIVKHQKADGWFADTGLAPTLSIGIGNASLARARQCGVAFDDAVLERAFKLSEASANGTVTFSPLGPITTPPLPAGITPAVPKVPGVAGLGDAGATLYRVAQGAGNAQMIVVALRALKRPAPGDRTKSQRALDALKKAEAANEKIQTLLAKRIRDNAFVAGFGSNGGEEFLSFLNISEALVVRGGKDWELWDARMVKELEKAQDRDGSWSGHHCVTGKTFCTSTALLVLMADRTPFPVAALK